MGNYNLVVFFVGLVGAAVLSGHPDRLRVRARHLRLPGAHDPHAADGRRARMDEGMSHLILLAVPLFVFLGLLIEITGMARRMVASWRA